MAKKRNRKPPSRERYEKENPVVSFRVPRKTKELLNESKERDGKSNAYYLQVGLGVTGAEAKKEEEVREQAYGDGYEEGYAEAQRTYGVTYRCAVCGRPITVSSKEAKEAIKLQIAP